MALQITAVPDDPALLDLPWSVPLERWPTDRLVALPRGISRHVVRFVGIDDRVYAVKEAHQNLVEREYGLLRTLTRRGVPAVEAVGVLTGRETPAGEPLDPVLVTRHLQFSLPYRALFSGALQPDTADGLLDALAVLLVRLHLTGFYWGDCSLSNTLFRRDAGALAAYLVDAETGEYHTSLSDGQRGHDVELARVNIAGELLDLEAGGLLDERVDPVDTAEEIARRYEMLWAEITGPDEFDQTERWRLEQRVRRLNRLGYDVAEMRILTTAGGRRLLLQPKVVDAGHHTRRLLALTGLSVQENQARRLLNDLDTFRAAAGSRYEDEESVAKRWLAEVFRPVVNAVPEHLRAKLEPAEVFHEVLEHRWFLSESEGRDVGLRRAVDSYLADVLAHKPDERAVLGTPVTPSPGDDVS